MPNVDASGHEGLEATQVKETRARHRADTRRARDAHVPPPQRHEAAAAAGYEVEVPLEGCEHDRRVAGPFPSCAARVFKPVDIYATSREIPPSLAEQRLRFGWGVDPVSTVHPCLSRLSPTPGGCSAPFTARCHLTLTLTLSSVSSEASS